MSAWPFSSAASALRFRAVSIGDTDTWATLSCKGRYTERKLFVRKSFFRERVLVNLLLNPVVSFLFKLECEFGAAE